MWGMALVAITEGLSAFERLDRVEVAIAWLVFAAAAFVVGRRSHPLPVSQSVVASQPSVRPLSAIVSASDSLTRAQLAAIALLLLTTLILAFVAAPATSDSMTYHLPRIEHWIQNRSVAPYRSNIQRQLWPGPGAEYIILHVEILSRSDRAATLVQWAAYAADIVLASLLASQLGATLRGQSFAAFLAATMPGAVAQGTGSQVELVFAFWLACAVSLGLRMRNAERGTPWLGAAAAFGAATGLAILTKATAYIYFAPFAIWFLVASLRRGGLRAARLWLVAGGVAIAANAPHYYHNIVLYGSPLSEPGANGVVNSSFFPGGTVSNVVRNLSLHFGTPFGSVNSAAESAVIAIDRKLGVAPDDERTTFPGVTYHFEGRQSREQTAGSPIQVLIAVAAFVFLISAGRKRYRMQMTYMLCVAGGFLLFCFYLRWQPWHARLHVPLLMVAASASAFVIERTHSRILVWGVSGLALASALPPLLRNPPRPLLGAGAVYTIPRQRQYFAEYPQLYPIYKAATDHLKALGCRDIGLWVPGDAVEYPLWTLLRTNGRDGVRIRHVSIDNPSAALSRTPAGDNFTPCALVFINSEGRYKPLVVPEGYDLTWQQDIIRIYTPAAIR
jgi:Dolichyl-phosphate-mannose-protein mannosyltransferase